MPIALKALQNGPILVVIEGDTQAICRCGATKTSPFCDGTHKAKNFEAPEVILEIEVEGCNCLDDCKAVLH